MKIDEIKTQIINYVSKNPGTSFVEIERIFNKCGFDYAGESCICSPKFPNIVLWVNWNQPACGVVTSLMNDGILEASNTSVLSYAIDGKVLNVPIAKKPHQYKEPHWLPVSFCLNQHKAPKPQGR
jgi:hypothetical protein